MPDIKDIKNRAEEEIEKARELKDLDEIHKKYLGKKGEITQILRSLGELPQEEKAETGKEANEAKYFLSLRIQKKAALLQEKEVREAEDKEWLDITIPGKKPALGHLHPLTIAGRQVEEIFEKMGFSIVEGPEIETEYYNFDALNIPKDHPARDMWDTFWLRQNELKTRNEKLKTKSSKLLLRTHTSPVQVRFMETHQPPLRIIVPGRCFRHEATDASHDIQFYQLEGLMVDEKVTAANFKAVIQEFFQQFFKKPVKIRLRPSYFPFTEPSFEVDIACTTRMKSKIKNFTPLDMKLSNGARKSKRTYSVCGSDGWLEILGAGMVHPAVFEAVGYNPKNWQGFAFGLGLDRLAMMKYKIEDIRLFYKGDLRFLQQF